jgi:hypothetical protein
VFFFRQRDIVNKLGAKLIEQVWMHELVLIRDVKTNDSLAVKSFGELSSESIHVRLLHAKDGVGPSQVPFSNNDASVGLRAN